MVNFQLGGGSGPPRLASSLTHVEGPCKALASSGPLSFSCSYAIPLASWSVFLLRQQKIRVMMRIPQKMTARAMSPMTSQITQSGSCECYVGSSGTGTGVGVGGGKGGVGGVGVGVGGAGVGTASMDDPEYPAPFIPKLIVPFT